MLILNDLLMTCFSRKWPPDAITKLKFLSNVLCNTSFFSFFNGKLIYGLISKL